jgi:hypothetical protein
MQVTGKNEGIELRKQFILPRSARSMCCVLNPALESK